MEITLGELSDLVDGKIVRGDAGTILTGLATLPDAVPGDVAFYNNRKYYNDLVATEAGAVLVAGGLAREDSEKVPAALVEVTDPTLAFTRLVEEFSPPEKPFTPGIHPAAVIAESAAFNRDKVCIGPCAVIEDGAVIGDGTQIGAGCFLGAGAVLGENCRLHPNVTIYGCATVGNHALFHGGVVIGADGFGFEMVDGKRVKVPQVGTVQIDDDVEIGANSCVDRARFGRTWIQEGVKLDNLVQIGHNCVIGKHTVIAAIGGIGGSVHFGARVTCGAHVGVAPHMKIGDDAFIAGKSGIIDNLEGNDTYMWFPARPAREARKSIALRLRLPQLYARIKALEKKLEEKG